MLAVAPRQLKFMHTVAYILFFSYLPNGSIE